MKMMKFHAIFVTVLLLFFGLFELGMCKHEMIQTFGRKMMKAAKEIPTDVPEIQRFAISAVEQYNIEQSGVLEFVKVLKAKEQVGAARIYYLTLEAVDAGRRKIYEAKIWVKSWMNVNMTQVLEFKLAHDICQDDLPLDNM